MVDPVFKDNSKIGTVKKEKKNKLTNIHEDSRASGNKIFADLINKGFLVSYARDTKFRDVPIHRANLNAEWQEEQSDRTCAPNPTHHTKR